MGPGAARRLRARPADRARRGAPAGRRPDRALPARVRSAALGRQGSHRPAPVRRRQHPPAGPDHRARARLVGVCRADRARRSGRERTRMPWTPVLGWPLVHFGLFILIALLRGHYSYGASLVGQPLRLVAYAAIAVTLVGMTPERMYRMLLWVFYPGRGDQPALGRLLHRDRRLAVRVGRPVDRRQPTARDLDEPLLRRRAVPRALHDPQVTGTRYRAAASRNGRDRARRGDPRLRARRLRRRRDRAGRAARRLAGCSPRRVLRIAACDPVPDPLLGDHRPHRAEPRLVVPASCLRLAVAGRERDLARAGERRGARTGARAAGLRRRLRAVVDVLPRRTELERLLRSVPPGHRAGPAQRVPLPAGRAAGCSRSARICGSSASSRSMPSAATGAARPTPSDC